MTIQQLEYIIAVNEFRHFARAAEHCGVTQPTLSAMTQKLEEELGVKIFDRHVQPVVPTNIGAKIIKQAELVREQVSRVRDIIREEKQEAKGLFRMAVLPTIAPYLLPRFFPQLREKYPEIDIRVVERKTHEVIAALHRDEIDAGIIANHTEEADLNDDVLFYDEFFGYVSKKENMFKNELVRTSDISGSRLWLLDEGHCFRDQLLKFCQMDSVKSNQMIYQLGSLETFMRMVEGGQGLTFVPELATFQLNEQQKELVRPFAVPRPARPIVLVTKKDFVRNSLLELLKAEIKKAVPEDMLMLKAVQALV